MKKILLFLLVYTLLAGSCEKRKAPRPNFGVYGLMDVTMVNDGFSVVTLPLTVSYTDDPGNLHELIKLSVSGLPANVIPDTGWVHEGYPPFNTSLRFIATTYDGIWPGTYTVTVTATSTTMGTRQITFDLTIVKAPNCTGGLVGKYDYCYSYCNNKEYTDSVYDDPFLANKIWFSNFNGTGMRAYAMLNCYTKFLSIPPQTIKGITYEGGSLCPYVREMSIYLHYGSTECTMTLH